MKTKKKKEPNIVYTLQRFETLQVKEADYDSGTLVFSLDGKELFRLYVSSIEDILKWAKK